MANKILVGILCFAGFSIPLLMAGLSMIVPAAEKMLEAEIDPGLTPGFEPVGCLTIVYAKGG